MQRAAAAARVAAEAAAAEAQRAETDLAGARDAVARFARSSYMSGSSSPLLESLLTSSGPAQIVQRAALLDAAGSYRSTAVSAASTARERAVETQSRRAERTDGGRPPAGSSAGRTRLGGGGQDRCNAGGGRSPGPAERCGERAPSGAGHAGGPAGAAGRSAPGVPVVVLAAGTLRRRRSGRQSGARSLGSRLGRGRPVRVRWQLEHQHRQRLLRRAPVQRIDVAGVRRNAVRAARRPRHPGAADRSRGEGARRPGPGAWPTCGRNL